MCIIVGGTHGMNKFFPHLFHEKWKNECRNLEKGDVVFLYYPSSIQDEYRLAKVVDVRPDQKGRVRTVRIAYRKRNKREDPRTYKFKPLTEEWVSVQRLSVLLPITEQGLPPVQKSRYVGLC